MNFDARSFGLLGLAACATLLANPVKAHIPFIEPEAREADPSSVPDEDRTETDYSFKNPFPLEDDVAFQNEPGNTFEYDGIDSMALNGYLVPDDVDVFKVVPASNEAVPFLGVAVLAAALPPACNELIDAYPLMALVGPKLPRDPAVLALLPFDIDDPDEVPQPAEGMNGAIFAPNPENEPREIFVEDVVTGLSWFLPEGQTQQCLEPPSIPLQDCETLENSILISTALGDEIVAGEPYYLAIWDPQGREQDYTVTLGVTDAHYVDRPDINAEIECFNLIHGECTPPPNPPEGYFSQVCEDGAGGSGGSGGSGGDGGDGGSGGDGGDGDGNGDDGGGGCSVGSTQDSGSMLAMLALLGLLVRWRGARTRRSRS